MSDTKGAIGDTEEATCTGNTEGAIGDTEGAIHFSVG